VGSEADASNCQRLQQLGCEILHCDGSDHSSRLAFLLDHLGSRQFTNLLVEGGSGLFGSLLDLDQIDEVHAFIAPRLLGGAVAVSPIAGHGFDAVDEALSLDRPHVQSIGDDIYVSGMVRRQARLD
jgi:diaminohydroxyphosphoribosylaminopyrimidine deaminase/5-amino-6-(5-phosphoribosylamino)uracil reductase